MTTDQEKRDAVDRLVHHVGQRVAKVSSSQVDARKDWLTHNFRRPLEDLIGKATRNARWYLWVNLVVIGGGFATSGIALATKGSGTAAWVVFSVGLLVALAGGLSQQFRFGFRSSESRTLVLALFKEGWHFALATGAYEGDDTKAWGQFGERVDALNERAAAVESIDSELPRKPEDPNA